MKVTNRRPKKDSYGEFHHLKHAIELNSNLKGEQYKMVLIHEVTHAALKVSGLDQLLSDEMQEALCVLMESFYKDIIKLEGEVEKC